MSDAQSSGRASSHIESDEHDTKRPVLIATDDKGLASTLVETLLEAGFIPISAHTKLDVLKSLADHDPALALVDCRMRGENKTPVYHAIRHSSPVPILLVADMLWKPDALPGGPLDCLFRPFGRAELVWRIKRLLRNAGDYNTSKHDDKALARQLVEMKSLSTIGRALTSVLKLDTVLTLVVESAVHLTNAEEGLILLLDDDQKELYLRAAVGMDEELAEAFRVRSGDSLAWQAIKTMKPILVSAKGWQKIKTAYLVRSLLYVPLAIKDEPLGVLGVNNRRVERDFTDHDRDLLMTLGSYAAVAIENARLFSRLNRSLAELKETQAQLVHAARLSAMGELATAVAHQINNPLTTILGDAELALADLAPTHPAYESVRAIYRAGRRAREVVSRLLGVVRRKNRDEIGPEDVNHTITNALELVSAHIEREGVQLIVRLADGLPLVNAAHGKLEDVWLNLLLNARDAVVGRDGAQIGIESSLKDGYVQVVVWDNGHGMTHEVMERIFEPFFTTKPPGVGTGIGLTVCRQIIDECGGSIGVESTPGQGSRFTVRLPSAERSDDGIYSGS